MTTAAPLPGAADGGRWQRVRRSVQTRTWLVYFPICFFSSATAMGTWQVRSGVGVGVGMFVWFVGMLTAAALAYRRRFPVATSLVTAAAPLTLPLDPVAALIAFGSMTVRRLDRVTAAVGAVTLAATTASTYRDSRGDSTDESLWQVFRGASPDGTPRAVEPLPMWVVLAISLGLLALAFGLAMVVRDQVHTRERRAADAAQRDVVTHLSDEIARQAERERIAREVHDALGHRLSMLSLHAGALEVSTAASDPGAAQSAALVRANAQQSMADLRQLLATLETPGAPDAAAAVPALREVGALVDETVQTGVRLVSTVQLDSVDQLDEQTSRSAYRLAQELLTNARKHAPGIGVRVLVHAAPDAGVTIEIANLLPEEVASAVRPGRGLTGAQTRVEQLGGQWRCWVDDARVFRVAAHLPWAWASGQRPEGTPP